MTFELVGVPFSSMARPGGIANAIGALREAGLSMPFDAGDLRLVAGDGTRGASGLLNEGALAGLVASTRAAVDAVLERGRRPLLVGGDCPVLLGALAAGRDRFGRVGLLLVDGHEDAWPPRLSPTGEASDSEIGIALGRVAGLPAPLGGLVPLLRPQDLAMLGPRDRVEIEAAGERSLRDQVAAFGLDAAAALAALGDRRFWLHIDLDVLSTDAFPAADYLQPGGLTWAELTDIARLALASGRCFGAGVVIYNPDLDPERTSAARVVRFISSLK